MFDRVIERIAKKWLPVFRKKMRETGKIEHKCELSKTHYALNKVIFLAMASALFGCGGSGSGGGNTGGGGGGGAINPVTKFPSLYSSWHFDALNYKTVQDKSLTGKGVLVAVIDTGIDKDHPYLSHVISPDSIRFVDGRKNSDFQDNDGHGTEMAGLIAGGNYKNGELIGIAPEAEILVIAANNYKGDTDEFGSETSLVAALEYAADQDADIVNYSLGYPLDDLIEYNGWKDIENDHETLVAYIEDFEDIKAMQYATRRGTIIFIAAGNDENDSRPDYEAFMVGTDGMNDLAVAVTALDRSGGIAKFASPCDVYDPSFCIAVPGKDIKSTTDPDSIFFDDELGIDSGTSQATAIASGSMAILLQYFPELTPQDAVEIMLVTADDLGEKGVDRVYGVGALNLERALQPVGATSMRNGTEIAGTDRIVLARGMMGDGLALASEISSISVFDDYDRQYLLDVREAVHISDDVLDLKKDEFKANISTEYAGIRLEGVDYVGLRFGELQHDQVANRALYFLDSSGAANPFAELLDSRFYMGGSVGDFGYELRLATALDDESEGRQYLMGYGYRDFGAWQLGLGFSQFRENESFFGSTFSDAFAPIDYSLTNALHLVAKWQRDDASFFARGSLGQSEVEMKNSDGLFADFEDLRSSSFAVGVGYDNLFLDGDRLDIAVGQSLRLDQGKARLNEDAADAGDVDLTPSGQEMIYEIGYRMPLSDHFAVSTNFVYRDQPGHVKDAGSDQAFLLQAEYQF